jgi:hypothetical protein
MGGSPMSDETEADHPAWVRIKQWHDHGDMDRIEEMFQAYESVKSLKTVGKWIVIIGSGATKFLTWCAIIGGAYLAVTGSLESWIRSIR